MKFICDKCGEVKKVSFDGYHFGDRLLEGVIFDAVLDDKGNVSVSVQTESAAYFSDLNEKKWLAAALKYVQETDVVTCGKCGGECCGVETGALPASNKGVPAQCVNFSELLKADVERLRHAGHKIP